VILAGRRINEGMGAFISQSLVKMLAQADVPIRSARVGILGFTFKPNVTDLRNTKVIDIVKELREFGIDPLIHDPMVSAEEAAHEYKIRILPWSELTALDALIFAVPHEKLLSKPQKDLLALLRPGGILIDVKSVLDPSALPDGIRYWSL
jgi:UDP-N-acetyl-D-galactosamine dehydrogenase